MTAGGPGTAALSAGHAGGSPGLGPDPAPACHGLEPVRGSASATARNGSPSGSARAFARNLAARTVRRAAIGSMPASAITAWDGVDSGQLVIVRAAARISRPESSTCVVDVAGSQAAALCSGAPRTYPDATTRSCRSS